MRVVLCESGNANTWNSHGHTVFAYTGDQSAHVCEETPRRFAFIDMLMSGGNVTQKPASISVQQEGEACYLWHVGIRLYNHIVLYNDMGRAERPAF